MKTCPPPPSHSCSHRVSPLFLTFAVAGSLTYRSQACASSSICSLLSCLPSLRARSRREPGRLKRPQILTTISSVMSDDNWIPLVSFSSMSEEEAASSVVKGLQGSGFLLVQTNDISQALLDEVLCKLTSVFQGEEENFKEAIITHPTDPKSHCMFTGLEEFRTSKQNDPLLVDYWTRLNTLKHKILRSLAIGFGLEEGFFSSRHATENDSLRLLHYPPMAVNEGDAPRLRCKEHSDYGSITLLLRDDCPGLQVLREGRGWYDVPFVPGTLVLNAGSLLRDWTGGEIKATLHRVAAPAGSQGRHRHSAALFVDPDKTLVLRDLKQGDETIATMSVADYIQYRSGASGDGVAFISGES